MCDFLATEDLIDRVLKYHEHAQINNPDRRAQVIYNAQRAVSLIWNHRNWAFRNKTEASAIGVDGIITISSRFLSFGLDGGIFVDGQKDPLVWIERSVYNEAIATGIPAAGTPQFYTELGISGGSRLIGTVPLPTDTIGCSISYVMNAPPLTDADPGGLGNDSDTIPAEWHETCVYEGTVYYQMKDKANAQSVSEQWGMFQKHLANMAAEERGGRSAIKRFTPFNPRRRRRR